MRTDHYFNYPGSYHNGGAVVSYVDGHVEAHKWLDARTVSLPAGLDFHGHNYASAGNRDVVWIQERTSSRR